MRKPLILLILICGCSDPETEPPENGVPATLAFAGNLQDKNIAEASGLAASQRRPDVLWTHNDSGAKARLYAIDLSGRSVGRAKLKQADNVDWEDIASFTLDEIPYLLVADVGDNEHKRDTVMLYVVEEPDLTVDANPDITPAWRIEFSYPGGPRDVESVAVDIENERILLLAKRTIPAELYSLPLLPKSNELQIATLLGEIGSLPQPRAETSRLSHSRNSTAGLLRRSESRTPTSASCSRKVPRSQARATHGIGSRSPPVYWESAQEPTPRATGSTKCRGRGGRSVGAAPGGP